MSTLHVDYNKVYECYGVKIFKKTPINNNFKYQSLTLNRHTVPSFETIKQKES